MEFFYFDVGGTLIDPQPSVGAIYRKVLDRYGLHPDTQTLNRVFRETFDRHVRREGNGPLAMGRDEPETHAWWRRLVFEVLDGFQFDGDREGCYQDLFHAFEAPSAWIVHPDVRPTLSRLRRCGIRTGILSNWDYRLPPLLRSLDLLEGFDPVMVSCFEGLAKPSLDLYRRAVERCGVPAQRVGYVGDKRDLDLEPALAVGLDAWLIDRGLDPELTVPPRTVRSLLDLVPSDRL